MRRITASLLTLAALLLSSVSAHAQQTQSQHEFNLTLTPGKRWDATTHTRFRTRVSEGEFSQARVGPMVGFQLTQRVELEGSYFFTRKLSGSEGQTSRWVSEHRPVVGFEATVFDKGLTVDARTRVERFMGGSIEDFNRYRQRIQFSKSAAVTPYAGPEMLFDRNGLRSMRYAAGLEFQTGGGKLEFDLGCFYENGEQPGISSRHMLSTTIELARHHE
jgi:hypothetical protein